MKKNVAISYNKQPHRLLNKIQKNTVSEINDLINNGGFELLNNHCICGNPHEFEDVLLTEKDSWGINVGQVLCSKCGLIRNQHVFSHESNNLFYEHYYRKLYNSNNSVDKKYFFMQSRRGGEFLSLLKELSIIDDIKVVAELGCGAGGVLLPFAKAGKIVIGVDLNDDFLELGRKNGLNLKNGNFYDIIKDKNCDLIILSHVLEHLLDPIIEIKRLAQKIRDGKYLLIQVPGLFSSPQPHYPLSGFQIAHVYYFYKEWLEYLFIGFGFSVLYCDDKCTFVLKKGDRISNNVLIDDSLSEYPSMILERCINSQMTNKDLVKDVFLRPYKRVKSLIYHYLTSTGLYQKDYL